MEAVVTAVADTIQRMGHSGRNNDAKGLNRAKGNLGCQAWTTAVTYIYMLLQAEMDVNPVMSYSCSFLVPVRPGTEPCEMNHLAAFCFDFIFSSAIASIFLIFDRPNDSSEVSPGYVTWKVGFCYRRPSFDVRPRKETVYEFVHVCIGVKRIQKDFPLRGVEPRPPR